MNKETEYTTKINQLENKIEQLEKDIKDNDKEDSKRRNVVIGIIIGCFFLHFIGMFTHPFVILTALIILFADTITGWIILSKFENKETELKAKLEDTKKSLQEAKEEYENFLEEEYRYYSRPRINPTIVETPIQNHNNTINKNNGRK